MCNFEKIDRLPPISHLGYKKSEQEEGVGWIWKVFFLGFVRGSFYVEWSLDSFTYKKKMSR